MHMSITTIGNNLIHYEVLGRGKPVIFIHGWLGSWRYWWPTMQGLSARHRSFAFDFWGFGDSSKVIEMYTLNKYTGTLDQFIDKLGIRGPFTLIGHGLGAAIALQYTKYRAEYVDKVIAVSLPIHGNAISNRLANTEPATILKSIGKNNNFAEVDSEVKKTDPKAMNQLAKELLKANFVEDLLNCPRPILTIFGQQDPLVKTPSKELQDKGKNVYHVSLENCSHFPMLQEKAKFNRLVLDFIHATDELSEIAPKEMWQRRIR